MADVVVENLLQKLSSLQLQESSLFGGLDRVVPQIERSLVTMKASLQDADRRKYNNEGVRAWVEQVRDVAYEMEDVIDEFMYWEHRPNRGISRSLLARHRIAQEIRKIKSMLDEISERRLRYGIYEIEEATSSTDAGERWQGYKGPHAYFDFDEDRIVGTEKKKDELLGWLMESERCRMVISVVGIGGLGKSTLARIVYNSEIVQAHFDYRAWFLVSQFYQIEDLLRRMIQDFFRVKEEEVRNDLNKMDIGQLREMLNNCLQPKRYVIVLDDVWDEGVWMGLNYAFPDCHPGGRIIITSRNKNIVPPEGVRSRIFNLNLLTENEALELFCKRAFWNDCNQTQELEFWAKKFVQKSEGLPLAIVAIAGYMSFREKTAVEWKNAYNSLSWELDNNPMLESVKGILFLSYSDLPSPLKQCFLYCSVFPKEFLIRQSRLINLWIAEGFVRIKRDKTLEEVADEYLTELIFRSMLQLTKDGDVTMHGLMHELAVSMSMKENFCSIYDAGTEARQTSKARRLSIHECSENIFCGPIMPHLRSFFIFPTVSIQSSSLHTILSSSRLLRVLDLQEASIDSVPKELTNLFNLRYLNLRGTGIRELPKSLGRLGNLQTLDVAHTNIEKLPSGIVKLQNLRHLSMSVHFDKARRIFHCHKGITAPKGIWKLRNLQTLYDIEVEGETIRKIGEMTQLRILGISKFNAAERIELCSSIQKLNCLDFLSVSTGNEEESLTLENLSPPPLLKNLELGGHLEQIPHWFSSLNNLTYFRLHWSRLKEDPLAHLHALPNLEKLQLTNAYVGQQLRFLTGWFLRLKELWLEDLEQLIALGIEEGALPSIQNLNLRGCRGLKMVPQGIEYLTGLQELYLEEMSEEIVQGIRGADESKYHIPKIFII